MVADEDLDVGRERPLSDGRAAGPTITAGVGGGRGRWLIAAPALQRSRWRALSAGGGSRRSLEVDAALEELLQQMVIMTEEEMRDYFFGYLTRMYAAHPDPADQERPRRALEEFLRGRVAALETAMEKLARLRLRPTSCRVVL